MYEYLILCIFSCIDFLVNNAEAAELVQVLSNPKLLLPHYIGNCMHI